MAPIDDNSQGPGLNQGQTIVRAIFLAIAVLSTVVSLFIYVTVPFALLAWLAFGVVVVAQVAQDHHRGIDRGA